METLVHPADAAINSRLTKEDKIRFLREMFRIRGFATALVLNLMYLWIVVAIFDTLPSW